MIVYVIDDDSAIRDSLAVLIKQIGYQATCFESAVEFLSSWDGSLPCCIVLDVRMPGIDGFELQSILKCQDSSAPIIMMTGHGDELTSQAAMDNGAFAFMEKPFSTRDFIDTLQRAVNTVAE